MDGLRGSTFHRYMLPESHEPLIDTLGRRQAIAMNRRLFYEVDREKPVYDGVELGVGQG